MNKMRLPSKVPLVITILSYHFISGVAQKGFFEDTACSCTYFPPTGSTCVKPSGSSPGLCTKSACKGGYKCDLQGKEECTRSPCDKWSAAPDVDTRGEFACTLGPSECNTLLGTQVSPRRPEPTLGGCIYTDSECACSAKVESGEDSCLQVDERLTDDTGVCSLGNCKKNRFVCDCLAPTHICKRRPCMVWEASESKNKGSFACGTVDAKCVTSDVPFVQQPEVLVPTPAPITTIPSTTTLPKTKETTTSTTITTTNIPTTTIQTTTPGPVCPDLMCPNCYVPNAKCSSCIIDTSMTPEQAALCNPCASQGDEGDYCGSLFGLPDEVKCCPPTSACKKDRLPSRGIGHSTAAIICSDRCESSCDAVGAKTCSALGEYSLSMDGPGLLDDITSCSDIIFAGLNEM